LSVEKAIYSILTDPDAGTLVRAIASTRTYPVIAPQGATYPNVTFRRRSTDRQYTLDGNSLLPTAFIEVVSSALTYSEARDLGTAVKSCMDALAGTYGSVVVHKVFIEDEFDGFDFQMDSGGKERPVYTVTIVLKVSYRE
jgi:hypothetical protein